MNNTSEQILNYLHEIVSSNEEMLIVNINTDLEINYSIGNESLFLEHPIEKGAKISEIVPFLSGMLRENTSPIVLPKIETKANTISDVHILREPESLWIIFINKNKEYESLRTFLQPINKANYEKEIKTKYTDQLTYKIIETLGYAFFKKTGTNKFLLQGKLPTWFTNTFPKYNPKNEDLSTFIPFIEYFELEAAPVWETKKSKIIKSSIWTENSTIDNEIHLQATAFRIDESNYLLIEEPTTEVNLTQKVVQKARELTLTYEKLEKTEQDLKRLLDFKDQFVSIVSHDLRNPITSLLGIADLFTSNKQIMNSFDEFHQSMMQNLKEELQRLLDYNSKIYHWSNLELGNFKVNRKHIKLKKAVENAYLVHRKNISNKNISFENNVPENLTVFVDDALFNQVINNLLGNAVKFTHQYGTIKINAHQYNKKTIFIISDDGIGMTKEQTEVMFSPNYRKTTKGTYGEKGSGLGLEIVKNILDSHGFSIRVSTAPQRGSSFIITMPQSD